MKQSGVRGLSEDAMTEDVMRELCAVVAWCIEWDGECLGDNPDQLAWAKNVLARARSHRINASQTPPIVHNSEMK